MEKIVLQATQAYLMGLKKMSSIRRNPFAQPKSQAQVEVTLEEATAYIEKKWGNMDSAVTYAKAFVDLIENQNGKSIYYKDVIKSLSDIADNTMETSEMRAILSEFNVVSYSDRTQMYWKKK